MTREAVIGSRQPLHVVTDFPFYGFFNRHEGTFPRCQVTPRQGRLKKSVKRKIRYHVVAGHPAPGTRHLVFRHPAPCTRHLVFRKNRKNLFFGVPGPKSNFEILMIFYMPGNFYINSHFRAPRPVLTRKSAF